MAKKINKEYLLEFLESMIPGDVLSYDPKLFPLLREIIEEQGDAQIRRNACFQMGKLLRRSMDMEYCRFFIARLEQETDKYVLSDMLKGLGELTLPPEMGIDPIIALSRHENWMIRHQAIAALKASNTDASREAARYWVQQTDEKQYRFELVYAHAALSEIGTAQDVKLLEEHANSRFQDVKSSAQYAIDQIRRRENGTENKPFSAIRKFFRKSQKKT